MEVEIYSLEPVLEILDFSTTLEYYKEKLLFSVDWTYPDEGPVDHASVSLGTEKGDHGSHIHIQLSLGTSKTGFSGWLYFRLKMEYLVYLFEQYKKNGVTFSYELVDQPWGMKEFEIIEPNGYKFRFASPLD
ncbi:MAG: hypothetical protein INQ03_10330 [Candidatus Heimdallarchaeota archaeon]|nr:hypothetical protein [Candidatus Heimdallarchaeota archaeon]